MALTPDAGAAPGPVNESALLAYKTGANMNTTVDQQLTLTDYVSGANFIIDTVIFANPSVSMSVAGAAVHAETASGGQAYFGPTALAAMSVVGASYLRQGPQAASTATGAISDTGVVRHTAPYVHATTAQGAAATVDVYAYGRKMP